MSKFSAHDWARCTLQKPKFGMHRLDQTNSPFEWSATPNVVRGYYVFSVVSIKTIQRPWELVQSKWIQWTSYSALTSRRQGICYLLLLMQSYERGGRSEHWCLQAQKVICPSHDSVTSGPKQSPSTQLARKWRPDYEKAAKLRGFKRVLVHRDVKKSDRTDLSC